MSVIRLTIFLFFSLFIASGSEAKTRVLKKDLAGEWLIYQNNQFEKYQNHKKDHVSSVYFLVDADKFSGDYLVVKSASEFTLFVNGKYATAGQQKILSIDSLSQVFHSSALQVSVHAGLILPEGVQTVIETQLLNKAITPHEPLDKPGTFFHDFVIVALLLLLVLLITVVRINPKLTADYFSVMKIFSRRESDDNQIHTRITSSTNILFYFFCSLIMGFYLMIIFHFVSPGYSIAYSFKTESFSMAMLKWLELSLIILSLFFLKIILVYTTSFLFGSRGIAGFHFFNWVRLLLIVFGVMSVVVFTNFIWRGESQLFHILLFKLVAWCLIIWVIIIFLKLQGKTGFSMFHLFSYICATEIIPLLIIISVLYN